MPYLYLNTSPILHKPLKIKSIQEGELKLKLYEMGLLPTQEIVITGKAPFGDPISIRLGDHTLMLRKEEAQLIEIEEIG
jgi:ferrous iron transport protein A